jgi:peroxiredoxin Q/BCP
MRSNLFTVFLFAAHGGGGAAAPAKRPEPGQAAPDFAVAASTGKTVKLADFKGKKTVVLAFFPKVFTPG